MPGRILQTLLQSFTPEAVGDFVRKVAANFDDPIAKCKIEFGAWNSGASLRTVTITVIDRKEERYAPTLFRNKLGKSPGRWLVWFRCSGTEFGTPVNLIPLTASTGKVLEQGWAGFTYLLETDYSGVVVFTITDKFGGTNLWAHAGVAGLLRSAGVKWHSDDPPDPASEAGDPTV